MRDVYAIFGTLLAFGIAFPGWLVAWWLLFPARVDSAETHLAAHPLRCFWRGLLMLLLTGVPTFLLASVPLPFTQLAAAGITLLLLAIAALGAAALVLKMSRHLIAQSPALSPAKAFLLAAIALELAAIFPLIGWLLFVPITIILSFGAATYTIRLNPFRRRHTQPISDEIVLGNS